MNKMSEILSAYGLPPCAGLPLAGLKITKQYLLDRLAFTPVSAYTGLIPYYPRTYDESDSPSVSVYASPRDYHLFVKQLNASLPAKLARAFPGHNFVLFADHSPIDERDAAARAGLGVIGKNGLLITPEYSSFVFIYEIICDLEPDTEPQEPHFCEGCGLCLKACPAGGDMSRCLSAVTQKKGMLTAQEEQYIIENGSIWGCDICQQVCPHTIQARKNGTLYTEIDFFNEKTITSPAETDINNTEDFETRAYSWRGKETILRNIRLMKGQNGDK